AHADLLDLTIELWPYEVLASRAWQLRRNLSVYDASYVALAEIADAALVTLDRGIAGAPGLVCEVLTP
ncbi:MAG: type II toxin-antitoxin system VapC family toxin, partial [Solirubrobacteraceae bacterium]